MFPTLLFMQAFHLPHTHILDVVTCICLDVDGSHLISGSADLTCAVWKIEQNNGFSASLSKQPVQTLYGHDSCITAVVMYGDLDLAVSGDKVRGALAKIFCASFCTNIFGLIVHY